MSKISIIVPIYNIEKYISKCIDSVLAQTYKDWELILVDDGSTDNSGNICDEYTRKDSRIKVIHKENGGAASARNRGIDITTGEYITFIDGDDVLLNNDIYEKIINKFNYDNNLDVVQYDVIHNWNSGKENKRIYPFKTYDNNEDITEAFLKGNIHPSCCDKVFKRKIFDIVRFPNCKICEDISIIPLWIENIKIFNCSNIGYYGYRDNLNSTSKSALNYEKTCGIADAYFYYLSYCYKYDKLKSLTIQTYIGIMWCLCSSVRRNNREKVSEFYKKNFFMRLNLKEWLKICNKFTFNIIIKSFIACVLGPKWIFKFQSIFTRDN